jgi:hypothetical protein
VTDFGIVPSFSDLLYGFCGCFTAPSFGSFWALTCGWVLNLGRHTVTGTVRAARAVGYKHISSFHRFFSRARWANDRVGLVLLRLVVAHVPESEPVVVAIDDTLGRHTGKRIAAASMHRDPLLSTAARPLFHWGHGWVVLGVTIRVWGKTWCLPVLVRLYRGPKVCEVEQRAYRNCSELAAEMVSVLAAALPQRRIVVVADSSYSNHRLIKNRPSNVTIIGRSRLDAALYAPPPVRRPGQQGRPRVRGEKLPSPQQRAAAPNAAWLHRDVAVYGRIARVRLLCIDALWYVAGGSERLRLVLVRDFPGHERDDVFVCTDPTMSPESIVEAFALRWSLEVTFHDAKGKFGFEDPQNRSERAVERTAPMALWAYSLVVLWYLASGQHLSIARRSTALPWYSKPAPTFSDMLATLRRASWAHGLFDPHGNETTFQKRIGPLLDYLAACG